MSGSKHDFQRKRVRLCDDPFLNELRDEGLMYYSYSPEHEVEIVAVEGSVHDWAAYVESPYQPFPDVRAHGSKLPREAAERLFPSWAKAYKWRR